MRFASRVTSGRDYLINDPVLNLLLLEQDTKEAAGGFISLLNKGETNKIIG